MPGHPPHLARIIFEPMDQDHGISGGTIRPGGRRTRFFTNVGGRFHTGANVHDPRTDASANAGPVGLIGRATK